MKLTCKACGETDMFWQRQYVRVDTAINGEGFDRSEPEVINWEDTIVNWQDKVGQTDYECGNCGSLNIKREET